MSSKSTLMERIHGMGWPTRSALVLCLLFLVPFVLSGVLVTLGGEPPISGDALFLAGGMVAGAIAVEWSWHNHGQQLLVSMLRLVLIAVAALWVNVSIGTLIPT